MRGMPRKQNHGGRIEYRKEQTLLGENDTDGQGELGREKIQAGKRSLNTGSQNDSVKMRTHT